MSRANPLDKLLASLKELGIHTVQDRNAGCEAGFPVAVPLADGRTVVLDLPSPGVLANLDPEGVGVAILDPLGYVRRTWGIAKRIRHFQTSKSVLDTKIGSFIESSYQTGQGSLYLDGYRYFTAALAAGDAQDIFVLVVNAKEEKHARREAGRSERMANALKRLGHALTMNQQVGPMCNAAAHEIASAAELAAVLIWANHSEEEDLRLAACIGINRQGQAVLTNLSHETGATCAAELVAASRNPFHQANVQDHVLTANLEAKCCYLRPSGLAVHPLVISDKLLGVIEFVGREGDSHFEDNAELFETIAEHLALAMNSALLFENFERWATHDALTGIANHRSIQEFLHQRVLEARRGKQEIGVVMMDVDHFRSFNEEEGHDAGDEVLKLVAEAVKSCLRPYDLAGRYGGEEFTLIMPGCSLANTLATSERIRRKVEALPLATRAGRQRHVTLSLGCAVYPHTASEPANLIKAADMALFDAKRGGRNRVTSFHGEFLGQGPAPQPQLDTVHDWIAPDDRDAAHAFLDKYEDEVTRLASSLCLSPSQIEILRALILVAPTYLRVVETGDDATIQSMEGAEEFRLLLPSLHCLHERFDGKGRSTLDGQKLPLLGRVLAVLLALADDEGREIVDDPRKFDPEIVGMMLELRHAA